MIWLAQGAVEIGGRIDLSAEDVYGDGRFPTRCGTGWFFEVEDPNRQVVGRAGVCWPRMTQALTRMGAALGMRIAGNLALIRLGENNTTGGRVYGNDFLMPLLGGSGGAGGRPAEGHNSRWPGGGGSGGGAILIASSVSIHFFIPIPTSNHHRLLAGPVFTPMGAKLG